MFECRWEAPGPENLILATTEIMLTDAVQQGKNAGKLVAVKFFAPWCQACKALRRIQMSPSSRSAIALHSNIAIKIALLVRFVVILF